MFAEYLPTNLELSVISFGGLALFFREIDEATALIEAALDEGINYIDCDDLGDTGEGRQGAGRGLALINKNGLCSIFFTI